jgi:hypothetical protein
MDGGILAKCTLFKYLQKKSFVPPDKCLPENELKLPYLLLGD